MLNVGNEYPVMLLQRILSHPPLSCGAERADARYFTLCVKEKWEENLFVGRRPQSGPTHVH